MSQDGCIGYVVAVYNQASGLPETVTSDSLCWDREDAEREAAAERARYAEIGRRETFVVCEVIPVSEEE